MDDMETATRARRRTRRPKKTTWRWLVSYRPRPGAAITEQTAYTREDADRFVAGLPDVAGEVRVIHVDHAGWRTEYPIRPVAEG